MTINNLTNDFIAIDTNVFVGLLNEQENINNHIGKLLTSLAFDKIKLLIDRGDGKIAKEYKNKLSRFFEKQGVRDGTTHQNHIEILRYWFRLETYKDVAVNQGDELMEAIKKIVTSGSATDRTFVYVAIKKNRTLITNDRKDIINIGTQREKRRQKLLNLARRSKKKCAKILTSEEAHEKVRGGT